MAEELLGCELDASARTVTLKPSTAVDARYRRYDRIETSTVTQEFVAPKHVSNLYLSNPLAFTNRTTASLHGLSLKFSQIS